MSVIISEAKDNGGCIKSNWPPDYQWQCFVLPEITVRLVDRPRLWHRFWHRFFFGWKWERIKK